MSLAQPRLQPFGRVWLRYRDAEFETLQPRHEAAAGGPHLGPHLHAEVLDPALRALAPQAPQVLLDRHDGLVGGEGRGHALAQGGFPSVGLGRGVGQGLPAGGEGGGGGRLGGAGLGGQLGGRGVREAISLLRELTTGWLTIS